MPKLQIDEVFTKNNIHPMLINFQNGYTTGKFQPTECVLLQDENSKTTIATQINDFVYTGEEEKEDLSKTIIIARNKNTGKVRLIEVGTAELKPVLKVDLDSTQLLETSNLELSRKFGSKKQKQQVEQREKLKVNVQIVNEQMQNVTQEVSVDNLDLSSYENPDSDDFYIPPINRDAQKPEQIYELDKILTEDEFDKIYSEVEGKDYASDIPSWVANLMTSKKNPKHIVLGMYAGVLLKLYLMLVKDIPKKMFTACKLSPTLNNIVLSNFLLNNNGKRSRPAPYKDKSLCHAIIFLLLINNLSLDLDILSQGIKLQPKTVTTKIRVTGASIVASGSKKLIQLKLPLKTKTVFRRKSKKF
ncbi:PREDICTED: DNA-directed RNA polymerase I subunit RPA49 [Papilio xuthus]|uniref:DNA-directed RNA polymerase I subunit RPA49 n=1 Tax=Papilio xuthus TaxID=66420 RepID=A0AAJ7E4R7_PAPXU|nr:PREDICTED: DNA-directed RNA polymerase I subunit RPA49 [Papilio xuthus]